MSYVIDGTNTSQFTLSGQDLGVVSGGAIAVWVKKTGTLTNNETPFYYQTDAASNEYFQFRLRTGNTVQTPIAQEFTQQINGTGTVVIDDWQLYIIEVDGTVARNKSIDGSDNGGFIGTLQPADDPDLYLGSWWSGADFNIFTGKIGPFAIFSSLGANQTEIDDTIDDMIAGTEFENLADATLVDWWDGSSLASETNAWTLTQEADATIDTDTPWTASASITPTDTTPIDGSLQTITASGMTGPLTAASEGGLDVFSGLSGTDPSVPITFTVDVSATEASTGMPRIGETSTISFTTATDGAVTTDVTMQPKASWTTVTLAGTLDKTANGFLDTLDTDLGVTSAVGDIIYYSNARGEAITATGVYTGGTTVAYQSTEFVIQRGLSLL